MRRAVPDRDRAADRLPAASPLAAPDSSSGHPSPVAGSTVAPADHWVSAAAVRQAIGAWAYTLGAGERRPDAEAVRGAVSVACAIRELTVDPARRRWTAAADAGGAEIAEDVAEVATRAGVSERETESALDLLARARVVVRRSGATAATVALVDAVLTPHPTVARIDWPVVRTRLEAVHASRAPALAVLRELGALVGAFDLTGDTLVVRASVRDLEDATAFGRSTVSEALAALERAGLLDVETRAGRTTRFTLRPAAFGLERDVPLPRADARHANGPGASARAPRATGASLSALATTATSAASAGAPPATTAPTMASATAPALIGTFAGTPIHAPPGTPLVVTVDDQGRWSCRVGPFLVLGPLSPD